MRPPRAAAGVVLAAALLAGCAAGPAADRRTEVAALTDAANAGDADRVRSRADALLQLLEAQRSSQELASGEADRLIALVRAVREGADVIDEDLLERRKAEAEAEQARLELEEAQRQLEQERQKAEEAARKTAEEQAKKAEEQDKKAEEQDKKKDDEDDDE